MNRLKPASDVVAIFEEFEARNPTPTTELQFGNEFQLLVAVILSAQATDRSVNLATKALFALVKTPEDMLELGIGSLSEFISSIGLFHSKSKYLINSSKILVEKFGSKVPMSRKDLESLPGVGRKTANVVLNTLVGEPVIAVDTHVKRVSRRLGVATSDNLLKLEQELYENIPQKYLKNAHNHLVLHGRYICKSRSYDCDNCFLKNWCNEGQK